MDDLGPLGLKNDGEPVEAGAEGWKGGGEGGTWGVGGWGGVRKRWVRIFWSRNQSQNSARVGFR